MRLPIHRWFRYSAGFSATWAGQLIREAAKGGKQRVFDPFAGSGTTLLAAAEAGCPSIGVEAHPFIHRIARAKLAREVSVPDYLALANAVLTSAAKTTPELSGYIRLPRDCYSDEALSDLDRLRRAVVAIQDGSPVAELVWLTLVAILRRCSHAGTAQWQYVLPKKSKRTTTAPFAAFGHMRDMIAADLLHREGGALADAAILHGDARVCAGVPDGFATLVVTSPPYPNNYDYADATRLEMSVLQEIGGWGDLQEVVRKGLVRSCSQHVPERAVDWRGVVAEPVLAPIRDEIHAVCAELAAVRLTKGGKKTYHNMVACYFLDLANTLHALRRVCAHPSRMCLVIGDSAPYGVYVPVADWLGRLALAAGFKSFTFERTRDRNVKWKNRKHRVPLCEGRLWVEG